MSEIKEVWPLGAFSQAEPENLPLKILEVQATSINKASKNLEVYASVVTVTGGHKNNLRHTLYLFPIQGHGYNYRYIEFIQPIDSFYPVKISAFQNGNTDFGSVNRDAGEQAIYQALEKIFNDPRTQIVLQQLKNIGKISNDFYEDRNNQTA